MEIDEDVYFAEELIKCNFEKVPSDLLEKLYYAAAAALQERDVNVV